jgi:methylated-DNA-protein-cysteine methyltransferase related protein
MAPGFSSPPDPVAYQLQVWELVRRVPAGRVVTYGQVAGMVPVPPGVAPPAYLAQAPRWVGSAMRSCPDDVPWQRVINSQGKISLPGESGEEQRRRLEDEGVQFDERGRIDLKRFGWTGEAPVEPDHPGTQDSPPRLPGF